ncbi:MAG TPA: HAMP domain-containing sensor histidine kinase [Microbacteriaceae bacterium]|nr:HAMP domain-containing sensor histidine kinase [Microbacteriaceae bacterium]
MIEGIQERWNRISLRTKITGVTVLMLTIGLLVSGVGTLSMLRNWVLDQSDQKLVAVAQGDLSTYFRTWNTPQDNVFIALYDSEGVLERYSWDPADRIADPVVPSRLGLTEAYKDASHVFTLRTASGAQVFRAVTTLVTVNGSMNYQPVIVAVSMVDSEKLLAAYLAIYLGLGLGVVILGGVLTRMLVTTTFAPLRNVEQTAARIADGDFSQRMDVETPNTEVGRLNRSLNTMLNRIDRALKDRAHTIRQMRRFVGDASHELRTPLVSVRGYAELYRMGALQTPEDVGGAMERIEKEAIRMSGLVEDLLELARLDEAKPLELAPVDLVLLARDAVLDASAANPDRTITLVAPLGHDRSNEAAVVSEPETPPIVPPPSTQRRPNQFTSPISIAGAAFARLRPRRRAVLPEPAVGSPSVSARLAVPSSETSHLLRGHPFAEGEIMVLGAENKLRQIVTNLVSNATRYTPDGSPIEICVSVDSHRPWAEIAVVDHGEGIPAPIRDRIFERFWRADTSRARETGGSGLGLAIVQSLVAAHNGVVDVVDTPGGGATFRVQLPLASHAVATHQHDSPR